MFYHVVSLKLIQNNIIYYKQDEKQDIPTQYHHVIDKHALSTRFRCHICQSAGCD